MATHSSILAWKFSWMEKPGKASWGRKTPLGLHGVERVGHD